MAECPYSFQHPAQNRRQTALGQQIMPGQPHIPLVQPARWPVGPSAANVGVPWRNRLAFVPWMSRVAEMAKKVVVWPAPVAIPTFAVTPPTNISILDKDFAAFGQGGVH